MKFLLLIITFFSLQTFSSESKQINSIKDAQEKIKNDCKEAKLNLEDENIFNCKNLTVSVSDVNNISIFYKKGMKEYFLNEILITKDLGYYLRKKHYQLLHERENELRHARYLDYLKTIERDINFLNSLK